MATYWAVTAIVGLMAVDSWAVNSAVLARVGSEVIMVDDLLRAERNMRRFSAENAREMLQPFIDRKLLVLEARAKGLDQHPDVVASVRQAHDRRLVERLYAEVTGDVSISEEELRSHFHQSGLHKKREVRASHIQIGNLEEARAVQERLRQGADFAVLAREQSLDRTSAPKGGDMGFWQEEEAQHSGFVAELFRLQVGQVSEPYRNSQGTYHLIKAAEERYVSFERQKKTLRQALEKQQKKDRWSKYLADQKTHFDFSVDAQVLGVLLQRGRLAEGGVPVLEAGDHARILLRYSGGSIDLNAYMALVEEAEPKRRPYAIDSTAVVEFAQDEALRKILLPLLAQQRELDREEAVVQFVRDKREEAMVEMLRRTEVESRFVTEEQRRTLYRDLAGEFTLPVRTFFAGALVDSKPASRAIAQRVRAGENMAEIMREYPAFKERVRQFDVFNFTLADTATAQGAMATMIQAVQGVPIGGIKGPLPIQLSGDMKGYLVLEVLAMRPEKTLSFSTPKVQSRIWRQLRYAHRHAIEEDFDSYLDELRHKYRTEIVVDEQVLSNLEK
jgi:parvulin-like peptidyl-prolyl isomerase